MPVNYRPVSLTSVTCKIMEHIIFKHIMQHLEKYDILVDYQHGFRQKRSCESQLVTTIEDIAKHLDKKEQVDMLILDFSKAFDVVPHIRLLRKLEHYGINGKIIEWVKAWLTQRQQCVAVEGETSTNAFVKSGVPQGTVLGPLMFLLYINDIGDDIKSKLRLFADDSLLYLAIDCKDDCNQLQKDLDKLIDWASKWQMKFNASKCYVLRITNKKKPILHNYHMHGQVLENVSQNPYLGVQFTNNLKWDIHINNITAKANKSLGFLRRNIGKFPEEIKKRAYQAIVRPNVEYASSAWDPYQENHIKQIEMVQRRSARFIKHQYSREPGSVTSLLKELKLPSLEIRRKIKRLCLFHKALHKKIAINIPDYVEQQGRTTRQYHRSKFRNLQTSTNTYKYSFFPRTIKDWNTLPIRLLNIEDAEAFKNSLTSYLTE